MQYQWTMTAVSDPSPTPSTGALSLVELRRHLLRRATALSVRARIHRARGDIVSATRMSNEANRLLRVAREMGRSARGQ